MSYPPDTGCPTPPLETRMDIGLSKSPSRSTSTALQTALRAQGKLKGGLIDGLGVERWRRSIGKARCRPPAASDHAAVSSLRSHSRRKRRSDSNRLASVFQWSVDRLAWMGRGAAFQICGGNRAFEFDNFLINLGKRSASGRRQTPQGFLVVKVVQLGFLSCASLSTRMREQGCRWMLLCFAFAVAVAVVVAVELPLCGE